MPSHREKHCDDRSRGWRDAATSSGHLEPQEDGRGSKDPPLEPSEGVKPWDTMIWNFQLLELSR